MNSRRIGLAYLFERFPSFTQTFCAREVEALTKQGLTFPVWSVRQVADEPQQHFDRGLYERTQYLPDVEKMAKRWWHPFAHQARGGRKKLLERWGPKGDRNRAYEAIWLGKKLRAQGVRHVHVHFSGLAARTAFWVKQFAGIPYSITAHANDFFVDHEGAHLAELFAEAKFVATVSDYSKHELEAAFPVLHGKIHRVYNGIDIDRFRPSAKRVKLEPPVIFSIGRLIEKKGFTDLIRACALLRALDFRCLIAGEGPLHSELTRQIRQEGLENKVFLVGAISEELVIEQLAESEIFCLACRTETTGGKDNLPTVIMEAMAAGLPVVSSRLAGVPEMVEDGQTGFLVPEQAPDQLAAALEKLLLEPQLRRSLGQTGQHLAESRFSSAITSSQLKDLFVKYGAV